MERGREERWQTPSRFSGSRPVSCFFSAQRSLPNSASEFGARLDTAADLVFVLACLIKLFPVLRIPFWLYVWIGIIALIKIGNIISGFAVKKRFVTVHSVMNKVTGTLMFLLPLTIPAVPLKYSVIVVCGAATLAAIQ